MNVQEDIVASVRSWAHDQAKRKGNAGISSISSATGFNLESSAKLMVNEYATVNEPYNVQQGCRHID
ncbi:hypothetical protein Tco_0852210 [Tanacetum coccineum]